MKFRTKYNPGNYTDYEHYEPGTSLTEPGQAETMQQLMERLTRFDDCRVVRPDINDSVVDDLMSDADLDEIEDDGRLGMAQAINDFNEVVNADRGSTAGTEAKEEQKSVSNDATTTTNAHDDGALDG